MDSNSHCRVAEALLPMDSPTPAPLEPPFAFLSAVVDAGPDLTRDDYYNFYDGSGFCVECCNLQLDTGLVHVIPGLVSRDLTTTSEEWIERVLRRFHHNKSINCACCEYLEQAFSQMFAVIIPRTKEIEKLLGSEDIVAPEKILESERIFPYEWNYKRLKA